jgi:predicted AlkP superfamily pyrophosphatase or phosphodiesterase
MKRALFAILLLLAGASPGAAAAPRRPALVVVIAVDQMRPDYFERFKSQLTGGFKRLAAEGVFYENADLEYANSETAPGHATLATGAYPSASGIVGNDWLDPATGKDVYCVADSAAGPVDGAGGEFSPKNLAVTALGDWLKAASPRSKVISVAGKDRSAVLMGGKRPDLALWYRARTGHMITSDYYVRRLPEWVKAFNDSDWVARNTPAAWTKLLPESAYAQDGPDDFHAEMQWGPGRVFPHPFHPERKADHHRTSPHWDRMLLDFALEAVRAEELGRRGVPDLLCVGLSATDYVGHTYGPDSHEIHDQILQLDLALGEFMKKLEAQVGGPIMIVLSADHAVTSTPEYLVEVKRVPAKRVAYRETVVPHVEQVSASLGKEWRLDVPVIRPGGVLDYAAAARAGVDARTLERRVREGLQRLDIVADVFFRRELGDRRTPDRPYLEQYRRSCYPGRGGDVFVRFRENVLVLGDPLAASHGTPYRDDTHVPLVFWRSGGKPARVARRVRTVDAAPTVARALGIRHPKTVDGRALKEVR